MSTSVELGKKTADYEIRQVRFSTRQYRAVEARAQELGLKVSTYMRLAVLKVTGSNAAREELSSYEKRIAVLEQEAEAG